MSQYHYLTGSREPMNVLLTRDDALQDPSTAFVKLKHDIETWSEFILSARNGAIEKTSKSNSFRLSRQGSGPQLYSTGLKVIYAW